MPLVGLVPERVERGMRDGVAGVDMGEDSVLSISVSAHSFYISQGYKVIKTQKVFIKLV